MSRLTETAKGRNRMNLTEALLLAAAGIMAVTLYPLHSAQHNVATNPHACQECGGVNPVWFAPNSVWNSVMGGSGGLLCPICFIARAEQSGLRPTGWELRPEGHDNQEDISGDDLIDRVLLQFLRGMRGGQ